MEKIEIIKDGSSKTVYQTESNEEVIIHYKDDTTAFKGIKRATILSKGIYNNKISSYLFNVLNENKIPTHFIKRLNDRDMLCKKVKMIPLKVVCRNLIAGSMAKKFDIKEGSVPKNVIYELYDKRDTLNSPLINDYEITALGILNESELLEIYQISKKVNEILKDLFDKKNIILVDFKLEFGYLPNGDIVLADELSPDTSRFWDKDTLKKLDKDRFRRDLGKVLEAYDEILKRLEA